MTFLYDFVRILIFTILLKKFNGLSKDQFVETVNLVCKIDKFSRFFGNLPIHLFWSRAISNFDYIHIAQTYSSLSQVSKGYDENSIFSQKSRMSRSFRFFWGTLYNLKREMALAVGPLKIRYGGNAVAQSKLMRKCFWTTVLPKHFFKMYIT